MLFSDTSRISENKLEIINKNFKCFTNIDDGIVILLTKAQLLFL
jgi:hypothetical protein